MPTGCSGIYPSFMSFEYAMMLLIDGLADEVACLF